jgi:A/G-specific adenine glycosylase
MIVPNFVSSLLTWYDANRRHLPWRDHPDPYAVLVSEFMLQQTTVTAVVPYFEKWMRRYPNIEMLAKADLEEVLRQWEGLGYYSRARNLYTTAREIVSEYGGRIPDAPADLKKLPGVGDYTAAAVASIAFGVRAPALDANNLRAWSRLLASSDKKRIARVFARVLPAARPGDFNQALMDLGTSLCTPKDPYCPACPFAPWCRAFRTEAVSEYPQKKAQPDTTHIEAAIGIIVRDEKVLVQRRPETGLMAGLWEFPGGKLKKDVNAYVGDCVDAKKPQAKTKRINARTLHAHTHTREPPEEAVVREVRKETGLRVQVCEKLGVFNHAYTRFRVKLHVFICKRKSGTVHNPTVRWVTLEELEGLAMPSVNRRIVKKLEERLTAEDVTPLA